MPRWDERMLLRSGRMVACLGHDGHYRGVQSVFEDSQAFWFFGVSEQYLCEDRDETKSWINLVSLGCSNKQGRAQESCVSVQQ